MIAECLRDYIGFRGCSTDEPESGLYLQDQPGISLVSVDKVADSDKATYIGVINAINTRAINRIASDVITTFAERYHLKRLTESVKLPENVDTSNVTAMSAQYRGIDIELELLDNLTYGRSGLQVIHIQQIRVYSLGVVSGATFEVIDQDTFEVLETVTKDLAVGWNVIITNKNYLSYHIFIGYDATAINSPSITLPEDSGCCCECVGCGARIQGATFDNVANTLSTGTETYGIAGTIGVQCSLETILCNNKALFKNCLFNLLAAELMRERLYTPRINKFTTVDYDTAKVMYQDFMTLYQNELQQVVNGIDLNTHDCCLVCDAPVHYVETTLW